jgi:small subunit ribosomal protein S9
MVTTAKKTVAPKKHVAKPAARKTAVKHVAAQTEPVKAVAASGDFHKALGRRKEATARVRLIPGGKGKIIVNGRPFEQYFSVEWHRQSILAPLLAVGENGSYDVSAKIEGGGISGQATSLQHGIARALLLVNPDYRKTLRRAGYLTRDPRAKERKKPGLKRARKRGQWAKR